MPEDTDFKAALERGCALQEQLLASVSRLADATVPSACLRWFLSWPVATGSEQAALGRTVHRRRVARAFARADERTQEGRAQACP